MEQSNTLIALLRSAVSGAPVQFHSDTEWSRLLAQARFHHVESMAHYALKGVPEVPEAVRDELSAAHKAGLFRDAQQDCAAGFVRDALTAAEVPHVLLRGALLKHDYPAPDMRSMSDLDYLVRVEDYPKIKAAMEGVGGRHVHTDGGHYSFVLPPRVSVEFHPNLIYTASPVGTAINPGWQYVKPGSGPCALELTEEGFYLNMMSHLAYHFAKGGTGVRSVLDIWVYRHRHTARPDPAFVRRELARSGLLDFAGQIERLSEGWFGEGDMTPELEELGGYILTSGVYGTKSRAVLNAASFSKRGTGRSALLAKAFYPRRELENRFPWVRGRPWLLPAAWCLRAARAVTRHRGHIRRWSRTAGAISAEEIARQREQLKRFGLLLQ